MGLSKQVSSWSVEEVLEWVQEQHPKQMATLHKAIIKHSISGRALLRLKEHHLEQLGVEAEKQQQEIVQDLLLLRVQEEINELSHICAGLETSRHFLSLPKPRLKDVGDEKPVKDEENEKWLTDI